MARRKTWMLSRQHESQQPEASSFQSVEAGLFEVDVGGVGGGGGGAVFTEFRNHCHCVQSDKNLTAKELQWNTSLRPVEGRSWQTQYFLYCVKELPTGTCLGDPSLPRDSCRKGPKWAETHPETSVQSVGCRGPWCQRHSGPKLRMPEESMQASIPEVDIPVVPHEAVAEVSRIGKV